MIAVAPREAWLPFVLVGGEYEEDQEGDVQVALEYLFQVVVIFPYQTLFL